MPERIDGIEVTLGADDSGLRAGFRQAEASLTDFEAKAKAVGDRLSDIGKTLSTRVTAPLTAIGVVGARAFDAQEKAVAGVSVRLRRFGDDAGAMLAELQSDAAALQQTSLFGDEEILQGVTQQLLTFGNVTGAVFDRAQQVALDLSTTLGQSLQSSAIQLGKALNDPTQGVSALSRVGVQFTDQQKATIKSLQESGKLFEAQGIILQELETYYGGAAQAAADAGTGGFTQAKNAIGDALESIGGAVVGTLAPAAAAVKRFAEDFKVAFDGLSPEAQSFAVKVGLAAAAIGPLAVGLGGAIKAAGAFAGAIKGLPALLGPVGIAAAAVAVAAGLIISNWEAVSGFFRENLSGALSGAREAFAAAREAAVEVARAARAAIEPAARAIGAAWELIGDDVLAVMNTLARVAGGSLALAFEVLGKTLAVVFTVAGNLARVLVEVGRGLGLLNRETAISREELRGLSKEARRVVGDGTRLVNASREVREAVLNVGDAALVAADNTAAADFSGLRNQLRGVANDARTATEALLAAQAYANFLNGIGANGPLFGRQPGNILGTAPTPPRVPTGPRLAPVPSGGSGGRVASGGDTARRVSDVQALRKRLAAELREIERLSLRPLAEAARELEALRRAFADYATLPASEFSGAEFETLRTRVDAATVAYREATTTAEASRAVTDRQSESISQLLQQIDGRNESLRAAAEREQILADAAAATTVQLDTQGLSVDNVREKLARFAAEARSVRIAEQFERRIESVRDYFAEVNQLAKSLTVTLAEGGARALDALGNGVADLALSLGALFSGPGGDLRLAELDAEDQRAALQEAFAAGEINAERLALSLQAVDDRLADIRRSAPTVANAFRDFGRVAGQVLAEIVRDLIAAIAKFAILAGIRAIFSGATGGVGGFLIGALGGGALTAPTAPAPVALGKAGGLTVAPARGPSLSDLASGVASLLSVRQSGPAQMRGAGVFIPHTVVAQSADAGNEARLASGGWS